MGRGGEQSGSSCNGRPCSPSSKGDQSAEGVSGEQPIEVGGPGHGPAGAQDAGATVSGDGGGDARKEPAVATTPPSSTPSSSSSSPPMSSEGNETGSPPPPPAAAAAKPPRGLSLFTWDEIKQHGGGVRTRGARGTGGPGGPEGSQPNHWIVIERRVYDVTAWAAAHPGGRRLLQHYAAEDATDAFRAFHPNLSVAKKYLQMFHIGDLAPGQPSHDNGKKRQLIEDFQSLRAAAETMGLFRASFTFFSLYLGHIFLLELLAWALLAVCGTGWGPTVVVTVMLATSQVQAGWLQHDFGHLSVFRTSRWNRLLHKFTIGHLKGASGSWWNHRHFQHHAKPNVFRKDPDVNMLHVFVLGRTQPVEYGVKKMKILPYDQQHKYYFLIGPPLLIPIYFHLQIMSTMIRRRDWVDLAWSVTYYIRYFLTYTPFYGLLGAMALIFMVRVIESHWFVWVTQMNHIPMDIDHEKHKDWTTMQLEATCNVEQSLFNDWFSGHLNFQIEHHLFPTMPRHNYCKVAPLVKSLCSKHGLDYQSKPLLTACVDVVRSLRASGQLWLDAYLHK